jgi:hypothetical protein
MAMCVSDMFLPERMLQNEFTNAEFKWKKLRVPLWQARPKLNGIKESTLCRKIKIDGNVL